MVMCDGALGRSDSLAQTGLREDHGVGRRDAA